MTERTSKFRLPQLKLAQKGLLIVAIPVLVQGGLYLELKRQLTISDAQAKQAELRREIVGLVNTLFLNGFYAFQSMVSFGVYGGNEAIIKRNRYMQTVKEQLDTLATMLERDAHEPISANNIRRVGKAFVDEFQAWKIKLDRDNQALSIFANIEANDRFKSAAISFLRTLQVTGQAQQAKLLPETSGERAFRGNLQRLFDLTVALDALIALGLALFFMRGTVSQLAVLKANANRFANNQLLLPPLDVRDEVGEVDKVFHEMAGALLAAQVKEHAMLDLLRAGKERLDLVIENIPLALVVTDENGIIQSFNSSAEKTFLHKPEDIIGKPLTVLFTRSSKDPETSPADFLNHLIAQENSSISLEAISQDSEVIPAEVSLTKFDSTEGIRYLATIKDISERFKLEQLKSDFYSMVSHDIRTPLASINGVLQLVTRGNYGEVPEEVEKKLHAAEKNVDKLLELVNKLLEIEKVESGSLDLNIVPASLNGLVDQSINSLSQFAEARKVKLVKVDSLIEVKADALYIGNVLTNLISNAVKFSPENSIVTIQSKDLGDQAEISVIDAGPGVPLRMQTQVFQKYRQLKTSRDRAQGFGLGLAICKTIVELHGGTIGVESRGEGGSRFWFRLPKAPVDSQIHEQSV
ncbi:MAG: PAS domain-containing sensor histidine kinase [Leptolyngbya sp.]|nr:PAS domain-containing sensor histidine kinase [Candidatus Melainabacteria bacterium]